MCETTKTMSDELASQGQRRGDLGVCPICGSEVHPQAYYCARCANYFCYICRSRVSSKDISLECTNRECEYFGKLVCDQCDLSNTVDEQAYVYKEPTDGYWPAWLVVSCVVAAYVVWRTTWLAGGLAFLGLYLLVGGLMQAMGLNIFGKERRVELPRSSTTYACARCTHPAKLVSLSPKP
jgi:hypothetical protein